MGKLSINPTVGLMSGFDPTMAATTQFMLILVLLNQLIVIHRFLNTSLSLFNTCVWRVYFINAHTYVCIYNKCLHKYIYECIFKCKLHYV